MHLCKMNNLSAPYILIKLFLSQAIKKKYCLLAVVCFPLSNFFFFFLLILAQLKIVLLYFVMNYEFGPFGVKRNLIFFN